MDKLENYRRIIQEVLTDYSNRKLLNEEKADEFVRQTVFDTQNDHYQVMNVGWEEFDRTFSIPIHIDIKNGQAWVQQNMTDYDFITELIEKGIPKKDIILAFHPPYKRPYTGFGVGV